MQATIVALYRHKPAALTALLDECQRRVAEGLGICFRPYALPQVHATMVGLEREAGVAVPFANRNEYRLGGRVADMDFAGLLAWLRREACPFRIRLGGYADGDASFASRGRPPFERSFTIQGDKVVLMGWPVRRGRPAVLNELRRGARAFNVRHAYHREADDVDNDFFMRVGMIDQPKQLDAGARDAVCEAMRIWLAGREPLEVEVTLADLYVVAYDSPELPVDQTHSLSLTDTMLDAARLRSLY